MSVEDRERAVADAVPTQLFINGPVAAQQCWEVV
jgi:hypothetical protein